jgi:hypothetical protein
MLRTFLILALFREIFDFKVDVPNLSFGTEKSFKFVSLSCSLFHLKFLVIVLLYYDNYKKVINRVKKV